MRVRSVKLPKDLDAQLTNYAQRTGTSPSAVAREAIAAYVASTPASGRISFLDAAADLAGSVNGPSDLSTNSKYLDDLGR